MRSKPFIHNRPFHFSVFLISLLMPASAPGYFPATQSSTDYLPLVVGSSYEYSYSYVVGKETKQKDARAIRLMSLTVFDEPWFYFIRAADYKQKEKDIELTVFPCIGIFRKHEKGVSCMDAPFTDMLRSQSHSFLHLPLKQGEKLLFYRDSLVFPTPDSNVVTVEAFETVTVPAGTFQNCARISISGNYSEPLTTYWLAPNVGLVKKRETAPAPSAGFALYELKQFSIPGK
jgi:hypothetical protein